MAYLVLARKYRPATFTEIVGQEHVTRALENAIRLDRVAHAFLFTGARGVGKTTAARVLAKALQCERGPTPEPCSECRACTEITAGSAIDVYEIDGASNRGINEIRELRDGIAYAPQRDRFKIYIIDEVHMLTSEAFNALLKTLEEPPRHVKFIFATTEPQKIPVTILSRCQRYDFKRVPLRQVKAHLDHLLAEEGVSIAEEGVRMVARESEGSVRDALSLLDRVISFAGDEADQKMVADCLGIADRKWLVDLVRALLAGDAAAALAVVSDIHNYGYDMRAFTAELLNTVRDMTVVKLCGPGARSVELSDSEAKSLARIGADQSVTALQRIFQILLKASDDVAQSRHPRLVLEMAVVRASTVLELQAVPELLERLQALEQRLTAGGVMLPPPQPASPARSPSPSRPAPQAQPAPQPAPSPPMRAAAPREVQARPEPPLAEPPPVEPPAMRDPPPTQTNSLEQSTWPTLVMQLKKSDPLLASMLENAALVSASMGTATIGVANKFYRDQLATGSNHDRLAERLLSDYGLHRLVIEEVQQTTETIASERAGRRSKEAESRRERVLSHPVTKAVVESMEGTVVDVKAEEVLDD